MLQSRESVGVGLAPTRLSMYFLRGEVLQNMARRTRASYEQTQRRFCDGRNLVRQPRTGGIAGCSVLI